MVLGAYSWLHAQELWQAVLKPRSTAFMQTLYPEHYHSSPYIDLFLYPWSEIVVKYSSKIKSDQGCRHETWATVPSTKHSYTHTHAHRQSHITCIHTLTQHTQTQHTHTTLTKTHSFIHIQHTHKHTTAFTHSHTISTHSTHKHIIHKYSRLHTCLKPDTRFSRIDLFPQYGPLEAESNQFNQV